jgi:hypothetical protein
MRSFRSLKSVLLVVLFTAGAACGAGVTEENVDPDDDDDGDTIQNQHEGSADREDTDDDGSPDYLDLDSDNDGVPDRTEAGDELPQTPPVDSDTDGRLDFRDTDSDANGRPDGTDGTNDLDGDDRLDFQDPDDDNDTINDLIEIGTNPTVPVDTDSDTTPDFRDTESDGDTIFDMWEGADDYDLDLSENFRDRDSDGDCLLDSLEAGGDPPRDTDGDGRPDFIDRDSDSDGLADGDEDFNCDGIRGSSESDPLDPDTDDDGVTDLVEAHAGTNANNPNDNPASRGDFFFLIPYEMPTTPVEDTLRFRTNVQFADLYFSFDITGSMGAEMQAMANPSTGVPAIISGLTCPTAGGACSVDQDCGTNAICFDGGCIRDPLTAPGCVPNLWTGVGHWSDHNTFKNTLSIQSNPLTTAMSVTQTLTGGSEPVFEAAQCVADGVGCTSPVKQCATTGVGCPGFRSNAVRILIQVTDADNQCSGTGCTSYTATSAGAALLAAGIKFIGLFGTDDDGGTPGTPADAARAIGIAAGSISVSGQPFVYPAVDAQVVPSTSTAVLNILNSLPLNVTLAPGEVPGDAGDALRFIDHLVISTEGAQCTNVAQQADTNGDGYLDSFPRLIPGTRVCWDIFPVLQNTVAPPTTEPQLFIARITVNGDGSPLDTRDVFFLVPPVLDDPVD